jgi:uncharacterized protein (DUF342 family)
MSSENDVIKSSENPAPVENIPNIMGFDSARGLQIEVDSSKLSAKLILKPALIMGRPLTTADFYETFERYTLGYNQILVNEIASRLAEINEITSKKENLPKILEYVIAKGTPAIEGVDGWIKFVFPKAKRVTLKENGTADYRNIDRYIHVKQGDQVASTFEGIPGSPGIDVFGDTINPSPIKKPKLILGKNISTISQKDPDYPERSINVYYATCNGVIFTTDNSVNVSPELNIESDIGLETGNIQFEGTIRVKGNIVEGSVVDCKSSLFVGGNVESHDIRVEENLEIKGGIKGRDRSKGKILVKGDLQAKFIENSNIEVHGDIVVENYILNSHVLCLGTVFVTSDTGSIISSDLTSYNAVSVANLGSNAQLDVTVEVGFHFLNDKLFNEGSERLKKFNAEMIEIEPKLLKIKEAIQRSRGKLDEKKKEEYKTYFENYAKKKQAIIVFAHKIEQLRTERFNSDSVKVVVRHGAFPGSTIKYRRQIEKIVKYQSSFMLNFYPSQEKAIMVAWKSE